MIAEPKHHPATAITPANDFMDRLNLNMNSADNALMSSSSLNLQQEDFSEPQPIDQYYVPL